MCERELPDEGEESAEKHLRVRRREKGVWRIESERFPRRRCDGGREQGERARVSIKAFKYLGE